MKKSLVATSARAAIALMLIAPAAVQAQDAANEKQAEGQENASGQDAALGGDFNAIVVTGRAAGGELRKAEVSYAITTLDDERLRLTNPVSAAETFKQVPGFWVESTGGEGSNNVRSRGIPTDGFSSVALQENGISVQYDGGLGYLNADQSFRFDETIERVEAVRGGPAAIFAPFAPGGVVNFITRKGTPDTGGLVKYTYGDYGYHRVDGYYGTGFGDFGILVGGFIRKSDGMRDMGFTADEGGQVRLTLSYDGPSTSVMFDAKHIDDKVAFFLPVPLIFDGEGGAKAVPGFDPLKGTLAGPENQVVTIKNVDEPFKFDLSEGTHTKLTQFTLDVRHDLGGGIGIESRTRHRTSDILRNGLFPTGNITSAAALRTANAAALAAFPGATRLELRYLDGTAFSDTANGNGGQTVQGNLLSVSVPIDEFSQDARLTAQFDAGGRHDFAAGGTVAFYDYRFDRYMGTTLLEVADNARRLDVVALNAANQVVGRVTDNGFVRYGSLYDNVEMKVNAVALYAADEWQITPELRIDLGARWEQTDFTGRVEQKRTVNLGDATTLADDSVTTGTGIFTPVDERFDDWGWTVGANYQFTPLMGVFARYTDTYRLPSAGEWNGNPTRTDQQSMPIKMAELGVKYGGRMFSAFATAFLTKYEDIRFTDNVWNPATNTFEQRIGFGSTETYGLEMEALVRPVEFFDFAVAATWQNPEYKGFRYTEVVSGNPVERNYDGNQLIRVPEVSFRAIPAVNLLGGRFRAELEIEHYSKRFGDIANTQPFDPYTLLNLNARMQMSESILLNLNITNLTDELGLTEGNPRAGTFVSGQSGPGYGLGRPVFGRTVRASIGFKF